ncbi:unnamed protein product [Mytilus edulis]|uniref:Uncharacterized protein n=1 Tax=Mytilus edulis TaxID=6550 RepID=A0A8S3T0J6_MYTED|nr:unnamed protein product [Mytilus edulis]
MLRRGTRKRTASARAGVRRTPVVSKGVSSRASVQSSMTVTRPEAIYTSGHDGAAIPTTATVSTTRMLMPTFSSNQDNSVHIPDMIPWQPRRAIDLQSTVDNTQFVSQTGTLIPRGQSVLPHPHEKPQNSGEAADNNFPNDKFLYKHHDRDHSCKQISSV